MKQVVESPGHEHVVVGAEHVRNHHCGKPHTWGQTKKEWDTRKCHCFLPPCPSLSLLNMLILEQHLGLFRGSEMFSLKKKKNKTVDLQIFRLTYKFQKNRQSKSLWQMFSFYFRSSYIKRTLFDNISKHTLRKENSVSHDSAVFLS